MLRIMASRLNIMWQFWCQFVDNYLIDSEESSSDTGQQRNCFMKVTILKHHISLLFAFLLFIERVFSFLVWFVPLSTEELHDLSVDDVNTIKFVYLLFSRQQQQLNNHKLPNWIQIGSKQQAASDCYFYTKGSTIRHIAGNIFFLLSCLHAAKSLVNKTMYIMMGV